VFVKAKKTPKDASKSFSEKENQIRGKYLKPQFGRRKVFWNKATELANK